MNGWAWTILGLVCLLQALTVRATSIDEICSVLPVNTLILEPESCTKWVRCASTIGSTQHEMGSCVAGTYFDTNTASCKSRDQVVCPYAKDNEVLCSNHNENSYLPDPADCNGFIYCKNGKALHSNCPNTMVFDPTSQSCVYTTQYACNPQSSSQYRSPICRSLRESQPLADEDDCTKYHVCDHGELTSETCAPAYAYDFTLGACVSVDTVVCHPKAKTPEPVSTICQDKPVNSYIADLKSCSGYYFCARPTEGIYDHQPKHFNCESGLFFDQTFLSCRERTQVRCQLDRCEGMHEQYVNVAGDCKNYAFCKNGETASTGRCQTPYYFDERAQSCTADVINYPACAAFTF